MSQATIRALKVLPILGVVLLLVGAGAFGDLPTGWWDTTGFLVNIASGATAACFGLPLAFFVLQRVVADTELHRVQTAARELLDEIQREWGSLLGGLDRDGVDQLIDGLERAAALIGSAPGTAIPDAARPVIESLRPRLPTLGLARLDDTEFQIGRIRMKWRFISDHLIPRMGLSPTRALQGQALWLEHGLTVVDPTPGLRALVEALGSTELPDAARTTDLLARAHRELEEVRSLRNTIDHARRILGGELRPGW